MDSFTCWTSLTLAVLSLYLLYSWLSHKYEYWGSRRVPFVKPTFLLGSMGPSFFRKQSMTENFQTVYINLKSNKFGGFYQFLTPIFMATDPDIIREVFVKHFDHFSDRRSITTEKTDPLIHRALINLKGAQWREMRNHLSPAFTTSKLRGMFPLIARCGEQFARFLVTRPRGEPLEFKAAFTRLTNDVVATIAFGVECNAVKDPEEKFYKLGKKLMDFSGLRNLIIFGYIMVPKLMTFLRIPFLSSVASDFFRQTIKQTLEYREREGVSRPDMLQLLMAAQKGGIERAHGDEQDAGTVGEDEHAAAAIRKQHLAAKDTDSQHPITDEDITAQAFLFFLAGFDTVATMLSFTAHELAVNPDVQQRLREEIDAAILENDGKLTYDNVQKMKYLDMVVSESLRKYPPAVITDRRCTKTYTIPGTDLIIEKDTIVMLPIYPLHRDPEYFPDPERFDPERFSEENKKNIKPYTYLPFGSGPHNCIGMRFALLEVKLCLCYLLATCELRVSAKTEVPLKLSKKTFQMTTDAGFWLDCEPREEPAIKLDSYDVIKCKERERERGGGDKAQTYRLRGGRVLAIICGAQRGGGGTTASQLAVHTTRSAESRRELHLVRSGRPTLSRMDSFTCWTSLALAALSLYLLYSWLSHKYEYWGSRRVPFVKPTFLLGSMGPSLFKKQSMIENFQTVYTELKSHKFGGFYQFTNPIFMPTDPDIIREIFVKSFDHFSDRRSITSEKTDPLIHRALINLKGQAWREMRNHLSPAFTTSKLRGMFPLIARCGEQFARFLVTRPRGEPLEFKAAFTRLTNDVVATIAFGVECNAVKDPEEKFYKLGQGIMDFKGIRNLILFGYITVPKLMTFLRIPFLRSDANEFFRQTIKQTLKYREREGVSRPDMLQLLMAAQKGGIERAHGDEQDAGTVGEDEHAAAISERHLAAKDTDSTHKNPITDEDITAQAFLFFLAGFDTVATMLSFTAHELAVNPDVQQRLREEIDAAILENDGKLTYDNVQKMKYLDMVVSESLRKHPPAGLTDRRCTKAFTIPGTDLVLEKDTVVILPMYPLHHDPEYFPNPDKFDPERFSEENKKNIKPYTYLPFGSGPHNCIGMRFALLEVKLCLCYLLATCELRVSAKTEVPLRLSKKTFQMTTDAGFWLDCVPREEPAIKL